MQGAIPDILSKTPETWHQEQNSKLEEAADMFYEGIMRAPGLVPIMPDGAMYMMVNTTLNTFMTPTHFYDTLNANFRSESTFPDFRNL